MEHLFKMVWYQLRPISVWHLHFIRHHNFLIANNSIYHPLAALVLQDAGHPKHKKKQTDQPEDGLCIAAKNFGMLRELLWKQKRNPVC